MAQIGTFTRDETGTYAGTINTLTLNVTATIKPCDRDNDRAPDFRRVASLAMLASAVPAATRRRLFARARRASPWASGSPLPTPCGRSSRTGAPVLPSVAPWACCSRFLH